MKKICITLITFVIIIFIIYNFTPILNPIKEEIEKKSPYVSDNGWLKVENTQIKNNKNNNFTLKGISSHGLQWYSDILTYDNLKNLKENWGINTFRIAMYTNENGYINNKENIIENLQEVTNYLIDLDMYVIIDWHTLTDNDPNIYIEDSKDFFDKISSLYANNPNVIYEICNEPNGNSITWDDNIKPYAETIIPIIRKNSPNSLIIVGTPSWCKELTPVANNPLNYKNILYSCHFYSGTHKEELRNEINKALDKNIPIIISEWGTTDASGNGNVDIEESKKWIEFLNNKNISYINWSFSYKDESSAIIKNNYIIDLKNNENNNKINNQNNIIDFNNYLTQSGEFVKSIIKVKN